MKGTLSPDTSASLILEVYDGRIRFELPGPEVRSNSDGLFAAQFAVSIYQQLVSVKLVSASGSILSTAAPMPGRIDSGGLLSMGSHLLSWVMIRQRHEYKAAGPPEAPPRREWTHGPDRARFYLLDSLVGAAFGFTSFADRIWAP